MTADAGPAAPVTATETGQPLHGAQVVARALKQQGVQTVFGVYGIPMESVMLAVQQEGMTFINTRHEQAAAFGAQCLGYLTRTLGVCMTVSGPGMTNAGSGMANAQANGWPLLVIALAVSTVAGIAVWYWRLHRRGARLVRTAAKAITEIARTPTRLLTLVGASAGISSVSLTVDWACVSRVPRV